MTIAQTTILELSKNRDRQVKLTHRQILEEVRKVHPGRSTEACIAWYQSKLNKGVIQYVKTSMSSEITIDEWLDRIQPS